MSGAIRVRAIESGDREQWSVLWAGYNAFYGRAGPTALRAEITDVTWNRFFDPQEPVFAFVAAEQDRLHGLAHYLFHRSTTRLEPVCYLQDLYTAEASRGRGVGRLLIEAVYTQAKAQGIQ